MRNKRMKLLSVTMMAAAMLLASGCTRDITTAEGGFIKKTEPATTESITEESTTVGKPDKPDYHKDDFVAEYTQLEDGTYEYNGKKYTYKNIISGMLPGNSYRSTMVVLSESNYTNFDIYATKIFESGKVNYENPNGYKVVELYHHDNFLQNGRYISELDGDSLFLELSEQYFTFWDFENVLDENDLEYHMSSIEPRLSYKEDCEYMIVGDSIKVYSNPSRSNIMIIDDYTLEYEGVQYVHESHSSKEVHKVVNKTGYPQYDELIELIVDINTNYEDPRQGCIDYGISYIFGSYNTYDYSGFYLLDLDGDGTEELLLGPNSEYSTIGIVYMIYTIQDGKLEMVCSGGERDTYHLCEDNYILEEGTGGAANGLEAYYRFENGKLVLVDGMVYDGWYNEDNPWYLCDESLNVETGIPITFEQVEEIRDKYTTIPIEFTLFEYPEYR